MRGVERIAGRVPGGEFGRAVAMLVTGTGLAQALVIASAPVLTRLYPPAAYGAFAAAISIVAILIAVTCLRYEYAIPLPESDVAAANVLVLALLLNLVLSGIAAVVLLTVGPALLGAIGAGTLGPYAVLLALGQLGGGTAVALGYWAVRVRTFGILAAARLVQAAGLVTVQLGLGIAGFGVAGLLAGDVVGRASGSGRLALSAWRGHADAMRHVTRAGMLEAATRYRRFPLFSGPSALLSVVAVQAPLLALVALYGAETGGRYALADRLSSIPLSLVASAVAQVYLGQIAGQARAGSGNLRTMFIQTTRRLAGLAVGPAILLALLAPVLAGPILGAPWAETGIIVTVLAPMFFVGFVTTATGDTLAVLERQDLQLVREVLRLMLLGGTIPIASALGLGAIHALVLLGITGCVTYVIYGLITWLALIQQAGRPPRHPHLGVPPGVPGGPVP